MYDFRRRKKKHFFNYDSEINGFIKSAVEKQGSNEKVNSTLPMKNGLFCDFEE